MSKTILYTYTQIEYKKGFKMKNSKNIIKKVLSGILIVALLNVGMVFLIETPAMADSCSLTTTSNFYGGSSTTGYCGNDRVSLTTTSNFFGGSSTNGYVGNNRYSTTTSDNFYGGSSTNGYSGNSRISLNSMSSILGNNTSGYVGNPSTSINSTNTSCIFWNC